jgi:type I restriction enzyme S subunit
VEWLGQVPEHWEVKAIKWATSVQRGASPRPIDDPKYFDDEGEYAWVRIADVTATNVYLTETTQRLSELGASLSVKMEPGSLFLSIAGSVGKVCITKIKCCIHDGFVYFPTLKDDTKYLFYIFEAGEAYKGLGKLGTQLNLNTDTIGSIKIPLPPLAEQRAIASYLDRETARMDTLIARQERMIELAQEKRRALIGHAVTRGLDESAPLKDSGVAWLGQVPEHWTHAAMKYIVSIPVTDGPHETPEFIDEGIAFLSAEAVKNNVLDFDRKRGYISPELHELYRQKCQPRLHDILMVKSGNTTGALAIVETEEVFAIWSPLALIRCNTGKVLPYFVFYFMQSEYFRSSVELSCSYGTQPNIGMGVIENLYVVIPPLSEQRAIVKYLDAETARLDTLISKARRAIELLKEHRSALIAAAVTGQIDVRS